MSGNLHSTDSHNQKKIYYAIGGLIALGFLIALLPFVLRGGGQAPDLNVRLIAKIDDDLPWSFKPSQAIFNAQIGETIKTFYIAKNVSPQTTAGQAVFHVSPPEAAIYISKIECFCFRKQELASGEEADMSLIFFVDPEIRSDPETRDLRNISFTYSFSYYEES